MPLNTCPANTYSLGATAVCSLTAAGKSYVNTASAPANCDNTEFSALGATSCTKNYAGYRNVDSTANAQTACAEGEFLIKDSAHTSSCKSCATDAAGKACSSDGNHVTCALGTYSVGGPACLPCPRGHSCPTNANPT